MSVLYVRARDNVVPATFAVDFNDIIDTPGPYMLGISGWITTADALALGALNFSVNYEDPTATMQQAIFGFSTSLLLADPTAFFATDMVMINRLSGSSIWTFDSQLTGLPGNALFSYRILHSSAAAGDIQAW